eukprot:950498-Prorocentrum_minimum.AAC.1
MPPRCSHRRASNRLAKAACSECVSLRAPAPPRRSIHESPVSPSDGTAGRSDGTAAVVLAPRRKRVAAAEPPPHPRKSSPPYTLPQHGSKRVASTESCPTPRPLSHLLWTRRASNLVRRSLAASELPRPKQTRDSGPTSSARWHCGRRFWRAGVRERHPPGTGGRGYRRRVGCPPRSPPLGALVGRP